MLSFRTLAVVGVSADEPQQMPAALLNTSVSCFYAGLMCELSASALCYGRCDRPRGSGGPVHLLDPSQLLEFAPGDELALDLEPAFVGSRAEHVVSPRLKAGLSSRLPNGYTVQRVNGHTRRHRRLSTLGSSFGERSILTICMYYPASAQGCNEAVLESQLWGVPGVAREVAVSSYGQVWISRARSRFVTVNMAGALAPQYTFTQLSCATARSEHIDVANERANISLAAFDHVEYILPSELTTDCDSCGVAPIGGSTSFVTCANAQTRLHEFGHNFGLGHSGTYTLGGAIDEYGDLTSVMGAPPRVTGFSGPSRLALGWITQAAGLSTPTVFALSPPSVGDADPICFLSQARRLQLRPLDRPALPTEAGDCTAGLLASANDEAVLGFGAGILGVTIVVSFRRAAFDAGVSSDRVQVHRGGTLGRLNEQIILLDELTSPGMSTSFTLVSSPRRRRRPRPSPRRCRRRHPRPCICACVGEYLVGMCGKWRHLLSRRRALRP